MIRRYLSFGLSISILFLALTARSYASNTSISVSPNKGSLNSEFSVSLDIDAHGEKFNAAEATVTLSKKLKIKNLVLGNCNFSFLTTPSATDPSFAGVLLGGSTSKCTVYTMTLIPTAKGNASIAITKASVRRYGDAANILTNINNGTYTNTEVLSASSTNLQASKDGLYSVSLTILSVDNKPASGKSVILNTSSG